MPEFPEARASVTTLDDPGGNLAEDASAGVESLSPYLPQLGTMSKQLRQTSKQIEESVVGVCDSFQGIAIRARATVARAVGFLGNDGSSSSDKRSFDGLIQECGGTLVRIMDTISETGAVSRRAIERIEQMDKASHQIGAALSQLDEIAKGNRMLALNARIEAAHVGAEGAGFTVVAVELAAQTFKSRAVTAQVAELAINLRALARSTVEDLQKMNERDAVRVEQCKKDVDASLADLKNAHGEMSEMLNAMTADGALLATDIGSAVRGMQFQDRVAQRIAHVVTDLDILQELLARHLRGETDRDPGNVSFDGPAADVGFSTYTMQEEREVAGMNAAEACGGDVELF
jgi:methyl-accepting chemotaxis protein